MNLKSTIIIKLKIKKDHIPVLGWCDLSEDQYFVDLMGAVQDGNYLICPSYKDIVHGDPCAFIFYDDFSKHKVCKVFIGEIYVIGFCPDLDAPVAYQFSPKKEIEIGGIGYILDGYLPEAIIQKYKKL